MFHLLSAASSDQQAHSNQCVVQFYSHNSFFISNNCVHGNVATESHPGASHRFSLTYIPYLSPVYFLVSFVSLLSPHGGSKCQSQPMASSCLITSSVT